MALSILHIFSGQFFDEQHLWFALHRPGVDDGFEIEGFVDMTEV